ncbi:hypothetical protein BG841_09045 [Marinobacter sp. X15-166B]|nr:hypothetical protein BG841_09045 [Marinobacter sp. X15-166B]
MAQELEIKLTLNECDLAAVLVWLKAQPCTALGASKRLENTYYDTPGADLNRQKAALRVRQQGDACVQTVKTQGRFVNGLHQRDEWEWPLATATLNLGLLADTPLAEGVNLAQLAPVFETNFSRQIVIIDDGEAVIECALDHGVVVAGSRQKPLCEVEFELKSGNPQRLLEWAGRLAQRCPVFVNLISKAEQGYYLAGVHAPAADAQPADAVIAWCRRLALAWLCGTAVDLQGLDEEALAVRAGQKAVTDALQRVMTQLQAGAEPATLLQDPTLGQLQLALLA